MKDPRQRARLGHHGLLKLLIAGIMSGSRALRSVETLGDSLAARVRTALGLTRAPSDTSLYTLLKAQPLTGFAQVLVRQVKEALLHKRIGNDLFARGVVAVDGKSVWTGMFKANPQCQDQSADDGLPRFQLMAQRACLVSSSARPVVAQRHIAAHSGEATTFPMLFAFLVKHFKRSFEIVTYDAGGTSRSNAALVDAAQKTYVFAVKGNQPTLFTAAKARLGNSDENIQSEAHTEERASGELVRRELARCRVEADDPEIDFPTARALWRQHTTRTRTLPGGTVEVHVEDRYFVTNEVMPAADALRVVRLHWGIENGPNWTQDVVLGEDAGTPCQRGNGVAAMSWLRLLAYNLLSMWRNKLPPVRDEVVASWRRSMETLRTALLLLGDVPASHV